MQNNPAVPAQGQGPSNPPPRTPQQVVEQLKRTPDCVIDVGVRRGTPWLYRAFPNIHHILVDPQPAGDTILDEAPQDFIFVNKGLGDKEGELVLHEQGLKSTFLDRTELTQSPRSNPHKVAVWTLDQLIDEYAASFNKIALKIDTEGFEVQILSGLTKHVDKIDFIIAEASVLNRFESQHDFPEVLWEFYQKGFRFYNLFDNLRRPAALVYDCIFFPSKDPIFSVLSP